MLYFLKLNTDKILQSLEKSCKIRVQSICEEVNELLKVFHHFPTTRRKSKNMQNEAMKVLEEFLSDMTVVNECMQADGVIGGRYGEPNEIAKAIAAKNLNVNCVPYPVFIKIS